MAPPVAPSSAPPAAPPIVAASDTGEAPRDESTVIPRQEGTGHVGEESAAFKRLVGPTLPSLSSTRPPPSRASSETSGPHRPPARKGNGLSLEFKIGGRWAAWVGALTIVVGTAVSIKIAYDSGWFRVISFPMRCAISAAFGMLMLGLGEVALRKVSRAASVGLFGAGLGTLYVTTLVSFRLEVLGSAGLTLGLLAVVACVGVAVAVRAGLLSIGVLSIIAGYAAPLLVPDASAFREALPSYLTMMLLIGLALSAWRPRPFRTLRIVTFSAHAMLATLWILNLGAGGGILELTFMSGWWMMLTGEVVYAAIRRQSSLGNPIISMLATAWYALFGCVLLNTSAALPTGLAGEFAAGVGVLASAIALQFGPGLDGLRRAPQNAMEKLAASLWVQAGSLLVIAAALQFSDYGTTIAWFVLGMAAIEIGWRIRSTAAERFGLLVGALGLLRLLSIDLFRGAGVTALTMGTITISQWSLLALGGIGALHFAAWRLRQTGSYPRTHTPGVLVIVAAILWLLAMQLDLRDHGLLVTVFWLGGAVVLAALGAVVTRVPYLQVGASMIAFTALRWVGVDMLAARVRSPMDWIAVTPLLNSGSLVGLLIIASGGLLLWIDRRSKRRCDVLDRESEAPVLYGMGLLLMILMSFEVDRGVAIYEHAQDEALRERWAPGQLLSLWLTLLWGLSGVFTAVFGAWQQRRTVFSIGAWAAALCSGVWLTWDTLYYRFAAPIGHARVVLNLQFFVGLMLAISLGAAVRLMGGRRSERRLTASFDPAGDFANVGLALVGIIGLWLGSLEIDRLFDPDFSSLANAAMARQTGLSIYWGVYGIALVAIGFAWRVAECRYVGLALLGITLLKVVIVDMRDVESIYRVMSLVGVGLLLVLTSIGYARMSSRLIGADRPDANAEEVSS